MFLDVQLPDEKVVGEIQKLVKNLVTMHELLRDTSRVSMRLVMTPDRMVVAEAMRTFTYLNLYGYLTDAVVVNRVFPDELADGYFSAWHGVQQEQLAAVARGFGPVPVLKAPFFADEVIGPEPLDGLAEALFAAHDPKAVLHDRITQALTQENGRAQLRLDLPFAQKGDVKLKKIGLELIVRVDGHKRTIALPTALAGYRPTSATLEQGALTVGFEHG
jgi:arsenite-transporting ATPase